MAGFFRGKFVVWVDMVNTRGVVDFVVVRMRMWQHRFMMVRMEQSYR